MASVETSTRRIIARLESEGWIRQTGGKHDKFKHPEKAGLIVVPRHRQQSPGVARSIAKAADWN